MNRRDFLLGAGAAALAAGVATSVDSSPARAAANNFKLKYAPHFGMFENHAPGGVIDELKFMADEGFMALEDNGMMGRPVDEQQSIADEMERLGMTMGVFVANAEFSKKTFVDGREETRDMIVDAMKQAVETAKRVNAKWTTVVPGMFDTRLEWDYQTANCIENLKHAAGVCEPHGLVMVLEPLNPWRDHPGLFLTKIPQAYQICQAVGSPSCKILDDLYHQQITEGNLIPNVDRAWEEIAYFQVGDNPGRKEPTTGEINYRMIFRHIHGKGFEGVVGMEH
ncbi:MAG: TIM barrel protein, partial [Candidatus Hydrogenedentales bacterium]